MGGESSDRERPMGGLCDADGVVVSSDLIWGIISGAVRCRCIGGMFGMFAADVGRRLDGINVEAERLARGRPSLSMGDERVIGVCEGAGAGDICGHVDRFSMGV